MESLRAWLQQNLPRGGGHDRARRLSPGQCAGAPSRAWWPCSIGELATIGHPFSDLAYLCGVPPEEGGFVGLDLGAQGVPSQAACVARYCQIAGCEEPADFDRYVAFSMFRLAAICAGVYKRALDGNAADQRALGFRERYLSIAQAGWSLAQGAAPH